MSINYLCDKVKKTQVISASRAALFAYSIGAVLGPVTAPAAVNMIGDNVALLIYCGLVMALLSLVCLSQICYEKVKGCLAKNHTAQFLLENKPEEKFAIMQPLLNNETVGYINVIDVEKNKQKQLCHCGLSKK